MVAPQQPTALVDQGLGDEGAFVGGLQRRPGDRDGRALQRAWCRRGGVGFEVLVVPAASAGVLDRAETGVEQAAQGGVVVQGGEGVPAVLHDHPRSRAAVRGSVDGSGHGGAHRGREGRGVLGWRRMGGPQLLEGVTQPGVVGVVGPAVRDEHVDQFGADRPQGAGDHQGVADRMVDVQDPHTGQGVPVAGGGSGQQRHRDDVPGIRPDVPARQAACMAAHPVAGRGDVNAHGGPGRDLQPDPRARRAGAVGGGHERIPASVSTSRTVRGWSCTVSAWTA